MALTTPIHTNEHSIDRVLRAGLPVLLVVEHKECAPCRQFDPALNTLAARYANKALIAKVDARSDPALLQRYGITQLPGVVFIKDGQVLGQTHGALPEVVLRDWLEYMVAGGTRPALPTGPSIPAPAPPGMARTTPADQQRPAPTARRGAPAHGPVVLTDATFDQVVRSSAQPVLIDFWAPWCGPCRAVAPTIEQLAREFAGRAVVAKLNVDEHPRTAQRLGVTGIPALYVFKQGQIVERTAGAQPAHLLRQLLARHIAG